MKDILNENFRDGLKEDYCLVDFYANWCGPCKRMTPELESFSGRNSDIEVLKVNIEDYNTLSSEFKIRAVPTLVFLKREDGVFVEKKRLSGFKKCAAIKEAFESIKV